MKRALFIFIFLLSLESVLGYIDPSTGGYLVTSFWAFLLGIFAIIGMFFRNKIIDPIRRHKMLSLVVFLVLVLGFLGFQQEEIIEILLM